MSGCFQKTNPNLSNPISSFQAIGWWFWTEVLKVCFKNKWFKSPLRSLLNMQFSTPSTGLTESESLGLGPETCILGVFLCVIKFENHCDLEPTLKSILSHESQQYTTTQPETSVCPNFLPTILLYSRLSTCSFTLLFSLPIIVKLGINNFADFD